MQCDSSLFVELDGVICAAHIHSYTYTFFLPLTQLSMLSLSLSLSLRSNTLASDELSSNGKSE